jgi:hypothetical protein
VRGEYGRSGKLEAPLALPADGRINGQPEIILKIKGADYSSRSDPDTMEKESKLRK